MIRIHQNGISSKLTLNETSYYSCKIEQQAFEDVPYVGEIRLGALPRKMIRLD